MIGIKELFKAKKLGRRDFWLYLLITEILAIVGLVISVLTIPALAFAVIICKYIFIFIIGLKRFADAGKKQVSFIVQYLAQKVLLIIAVILLAIPTFQCLGHLVGASFSNTMTLFYNMDSGRSAEYKEYKCKETKTSIVLVRNIAFILQSGLLISLMIDLSAKSKSQTKTD